MAQAKQSYSSVSMVQAKQSPSSVWSDVEPKQSQSSVSMVQAKQSSSVWSEASYSTPSANSAVQSSASSSMHTSYTTTPAMMQQQQATTAYLTSSVSTPAATTPLRDASVGDNPKILINPLANTTTATAEDDKKKSAATQIETTAYATETLSKVNAPLYPTGPSNTTSGLAAASSGSFQSNNTLPEYEGAASSSNIMAGSAIAFALAVAVFAL